MFNVAKYRQKLICTNDEHKSLYENKQRSEIKIHRITISYKALHYILISDCRGIVAYLELIEYIMNADNYNTRLGHTNDQWYFRDFPLSRIKN